MNTGFELIKNKLPPAYHAMVVDILENILKEADNPGILASYLTEQLRELTGTKIVILSQNLQSIGSSTQQFVYVNPERRRNLVESKEFMRLADLIINSMNPKIWDTEKETGEVIDLLVALEFKLSITVPLNVGVFRVGTLFLQVLHHLGNRVGEELPL